MSNNGPLKDKENFQPGMSRKSELGETLRVLKESMEYDEENTVTQADMELELDTDKIIERDVHVVEMNGKLREKLYGNYSCLVTLCYTLKFSVIFKEFKE